MGTLHKIGKIQGMLEQEFGREPSTEEIAKELDMPAEEINDTLKISNNHLSLDAPFSQSDNNSLKDIISDAMAPAPDNDLLYESLRREVGKALHSLSDREAEVISLYFGIGRDRALTLEEIGERFSLTRERVRQIKEKAIRRLRHATRSKSLRAYVS